MASVSRETVYCRPSIPIWAFLETRNCQLASHQWLDKWKFWIELMPKKIQNQASHLDSLLEQCHYRLSVLAFHYQNRLVLDVDSLARLPCDIYQPYTLPLAEKRRSMQGTPALATCMRGSSSSAQVFVRGGA